MKTQVQMRFIADFAMKKLILPSLVLLIVGEVRMGVLRPVAYFAKKDLTIPNLISHEVETSQACFKKKDKV